MPENDHKDECRHRLVTRSAVGQVTVCQGCGQVHLDLQNLTLRFEDEAFRELVSMLGQAQLRLDRARASVPVVEPVNKSFH